MGWGTSYTYHGYISRVNESELDDKIEEAKRINDMLWRELLGYMAMTPPTYAESEDGTRYPWPEFLSMKIQSLREEIEDNDRMIARIEDCIEALEEERKKESGD